MILLRLALLVSDLVERATALAAPPITVWWSPSNAHLDGSLVLYGLAFATVAFGSPLLFALPAGWAARSEGLERLALRSATLIATATLLVVVARFVTVGRVGLEVALTSIPLAIAGGLAAVGLREQRLRRTNAPCLVA